MKWGVVNVPSYTIKFVQVNGVRLHLLDWGGNGPHMCLLAGLGVSGYYYAELAARFSGSYHVIAVTRRGHGESDYPDTGYDVETLTEDLRQLLDALKMDHVILVGHSMAIVELCHFATLYPHRVLGLVFLEAGYDGRKEMALEAKNPLKGIRPPQQEAFTVDDYIQHLKTARPDLEDIWGPLLDEEVSHWVTKSPEGKIVDRMTPPIEEALLDACCGYSPELSTITAPVLCIYGIREDYDHYVLPHLTEQQRAAWVDYVHTQVLPFQRECIDQFRREIPHAKIVEIPHGHHYCFLKHGDLIFDEMNRFLQATT